MAVGAILNPGISATHGYASSSYRAAHTLVAVAMSRRAVANQPSTVPLHLEAVRLPAYAASGLASLLTDAEAFHVGP